METTAQKRQRFHQLLLRTGEVEYKAEIINSFFPGITSTKNLNDFQMSVLLADAEQRAGIRQKKAQRKPQKPESAGIRRMRNKVLLVLAERGIKATPKDWSKVNQELSAKRYQWILTDEQRQKGLINQKGLLAFNTVEDLQKLFKQLCRIRDLETLKK